MDGAGLLKCLFRRWEGSPCDTRFSSRRTEARDSPTPKEPRASVSQACSLAARAGGCRGTSRGSWSVPVSSGPTTTRERSRLLDALGIDAPHAQKHKDQKTAPRLKTCLLCARASLLRPSACPSGGTPTHARCCCRGGVFPAQSGERTRRVVARTGWRSFTNASLNPRRTMPARKRPASARQDKLESCVMTEITIVREKKRRQFTFCSMEIQPECRRRNQIVRNEHKTHIVAKCL